MKFSRITPTYILQKFYFLILKIVLGRFLTFKDLWVPESPKINFYCFWQISKCVVVCTVYFLLANKHKHIPAVVAEWAKSSTQIQVEMHQMSLRSSPFGTIVSISSMSSQLIQIIARRHIVQSRGNYYFLPLK